MKTITKSIRTTSLLALLIIAIFALFSFNLMQMEAVKNVAAELEESLQVSWELLRQKGQEFSVVDGKLMAGSYVINNNFEVPDKVQEIFGVVATVFMGNTRVSTNVLNADGSRAVGTRLEGPAYDAIFKEGKRYRGETLILGIPYLTAYDPIRNGKGEVIGALFVGVKKVDFLLRLTTVRIELSLLLSGLLAAFTTLMVLLSKVTKRFQNAKEEQKQFAESLVQNSAVPTFVLDSQHRVIMWNKACEELTGMKATEILGSDNQWQPFYPEKRAVLADIVLDGTFDDLPSLYDKYTRSPLTPDGLQGEGWFESLNGKDRFIFFDAEPVRDSEGKIIAAIETVQDITGRKRAEAEIMRLNENLEREVMERTKQLTDMQEELIRKEKLAILGQLSGTVGHELRNPLGVMSNAVYFLKMVLAEADETTKEYLDIIKKEIDNSQRIITDLLDFARTKTPQTKTVTARQLLDESLVKCVIPENVELQTELADTLPLLKIDPLQMEQVFQNLITNAFQAMPAGGVLRVAARCVHGDGDFVEISIADTGEGVTPENMKRLFQPLFTTKTKGIGLGLVVCKNLVEANGGRIEVASELGKGTTFTVMLPCTVNIKI